MRTERQGNSVTRSWGSVLLVGPDGTGKSSIAEALEAQLGDVLVVRAHFRPGRLFAPPASQSAVVDDPHRQEPRGRLTGLVKLLAIYLDTIVGTLTTWRRCADQGLLIVERGWYDIAVDPLRYRSPAVLEPVVVALGATLPRHDLCVHLKGDANVIDSRKPEIGTAEVARQSRAWERLAPRTAHEVLEIDTVSSSPEQAAGLIRSALARTRTP